MQLDIDLSEETSSDDLPDQAQDQVLPNFNKISTADVDNRTSNALGGVDDNVVVFCHVESIQFLDLFAWPVQYTFVNSVRDAVVDELRQDQPILAFVEHLERICREGK
jgi:hypothetical protein